MELLVLCFEHRRSSSDEKRCYASSASEFSEETAPTLSELLSKVRMKKTIVILPFTGFVRNLEILEFLEFWKFLAKAWDSLKNRCFFLQTLKNPWIFPGWLLINRVPSVFIMFWNISLFYQSFHRLFQLYFTVDRIQIHPRQIMYNIDWLFRKRLFPARFVRKGNLIALSL